MNHHRPITLPALLLLIGLGMLLLAAPNAKEIKWLNLSSKNGELPTPSESNQQNGSLIADLDRDGVRDFVLRFRKITSALVWKRVRLNMAKIAHSHRVSGQSYGGDYARARIMT